MMERVLVALDGSDHAIRALDLACAIADRFGAELLAVHVLSRKPCSDAERKMAAVEYHTEITRGIVSHKVAHLADCACLTGK